ncbi:hypothetical protein [Pseudonocardia humida]|uniref:DUF3558 domain-containing protein n=1 Tax=Pseudonocardia humida TaxID=2800819 RepID=A0ABT1A8B8_9PSEU|nr:hypothetical protein [Pseudonocardia humida]MCO1659257.1 hypothetical protein [Pseudonocardia humida]
MGRRIAISLVVAATAVLAGCGSPSIPGAAALQVPPGCERYLTVADVEEAMGRPVRAVLSENGEDCRFQLGEPAAEESVAIIVDIAPGSPDLPGLRAVDLDNLPPHGPRISPYYEVLDGRETLLALSGVSFYKLVATSRSTTAGTAATGLRPSMVAMAKKVATRL